MLGAAYLGRLRWLALAVCTMLLLTVGAKEMESEREARVKARAESEEREGKGDEVTAERLESARKPTDPEKGADAKAEGVLDVYNVLDFAQESQRHSRKGLSTASPTNPTFWDVPTPKEEDAFEPKNRKGFASTESQVQAFSDTPAEPVAVMAENKQGAAFAAMDGGWVRTGNTNLETMLATGSYVSISGCRGRGSLTVEGAGTDVALCTGNGYVIQGVNGAFTIYDTDGARLSGPLPLNDYMDPRCIYDADNKRFYFVIAQRGPKGEAYKANILLGVTQTDNPTGQWNLYSIDVASNGPEMCTDKNPCFADYPTLGQDKNGIWIAANLWTSEDPEFAGAKVWALAKEPLMSGSSVTPIGFINFNPPFMFIQPANPQGNATSNEADGGTMYLATSGSLNSLLIWTVTDTEKLKEGGVPDIGVGRYLASQQLEEPPNNPQQNGVEVNMGEWEVSGAAQIGGKLYMMASTGLERDGSNETRGLAWYIVDPQEAKVEKQGTIGLAGWDLFNPAMTASEDGDVLAFVAQTAGPSVPGVASVYGTIDGATGNVTSFKYFEEGPKGTFPIAISDVEELRTGDYSAIQLGEDGYVYASSQHTQRIPDVNGSFNWGTTIWGKQELV